MTCRRFAIGLFSLIAISANAETIEDRWPEQVEVDQALAATVWPKLDKVVKVRKQRHTFVCHKQYYLKRGYRHWRCKR